MNEELKKRATWRRFFSMGARGQRLLIALVMLLALAAFIHFKEVRVSILELDTKAKDYVVAQVDFQFPDEEGTYILRQQSSRDIGQIYRLDCKMIDKIRYQFENGLIENQNWRSLFRCASNVL